MNIFDFIPNHLRTNLTSDRSPAAPSNSAFCPSTTSHPQDNAEFGDATAADTVLQEWEQTCYSAWVEMEEDIYCFSAPLPQS
jgi:hypothetical protein